jgi:hypothetical protein
MRNGVSRVCYPTQAKERLEWGTQHLLVVWGEGIGPSASAQGGTAEAVPFVDRRYPKTRRSRSKDQSRRATRGSYYLDACVLEGDARNSQEAVFLVGVPVRLFLLERRRSRFSPQGVVPGNRLQSIMAGLKDHRRVSRFALNVVKLDGDLAPRIGPMSKGRDGTFAKVLCYRSRSVRTEAYAERRPGGPGRVGGIGRFRTVDAGIFRRGKRGSCDQRQDNRGAGYEKMQWSGSGSHNVLIIALG